SVDAGHLMLIGVLILSSLMNIVYLLAPPVRAFMDPPLGGGAKPREITEAPFFCLLPLILTGIGTVVLFFLMGPLTEYLQPLITGGVQ
ncbi:MAG: monovalent cation/H+ antiporter subunit D family protein, partial [Aquisalinus sp.]|nr:monovalent cation/H+ antiporter subunit D family protein [Aquisalinus sp.]